MDLGGIIARITLNFSGLSLIPSYKKMYLNYLILLMTKADLVVFTWRPAFYNWCNTKQNLLKWSLYVPVVIIS